MTDHQEKVGFIWSVADLLRGDYKQFGYGRVILPFIVLRRLDCVLLYLSLSLSVSTCFNFLSLL